MEYSAPNLEQAVSQFYHTDTNLQAQAHQWLTAARCSPNAWAFVWELLQPDKSQEAQFFAATTLHMKIMKNWCEVPVEQYETLKKQILQAIVNFALGPKIVLNRLCIALSAYILRTSPNFWPSAIPELLTMFSNTNLPSIPPDKTLWILLEVLAVIPEEFQSMNLVQSHKVNMRLELERNVSQVVGLVESVLAEHSSNGNQLLLQAVRCVSTWAELGIENSDTETLVHYLVNVIIVVSHNCPEVVDQSIEAINHISTHPTIHKYPSTIMNIMHRILPLSELIHGNSETLESNEMKTSIYGLFVNFAEAHPRLLLNSLLTESCESTMKLIHIILACSNALGYYPNDETYSQIAFGFWYILQDELSNCEPEHQDALLSLLFPVYQNLALVLIRKAEFHTYDVSAADKESFRCYRQDIADTMMYCYNVLRESLLNLLLEHLQTSLQSSSLDKWQPIESSLHGFFSIAESVNTNENERIPMFFSTLQALPYNKLNIRVAITALDAVGAYAEWISSHPEALSHVIPLLIIGLENAETAAASTLSLKDISRECQKSLLPYSELILSASLEILKGGKLKQSECVRLMYTVGKVLSILPLETVIHYLDALMLPCVDELQSLLTQEPSASVKSSLILRLKMLSVIFNTLDMQQSSESTIIKSSPSEQPVNLILERVLPVLVGIVDKWRNNASVIQAVFFALKHAVTTLLDLCTPLVPQILDILAASYRSHPFTDALDLARQLCLLFGKNSVHSSLIRSLLVIIVQTTLNLPFSEHTDIIEGFLQLCAQLLKKNPDLLIDTDGIDVSQLFSFATVAMGMAELQTVKAAASFLSNFISQSREVPVLLNAVQTGGEELVHRMLRCIGGESPRGCIEPFADIILTLNKKYCDNLSRWLQIQMSIEGFPSSKATHQSKQHFSKMVLKERANKRKLQETIREFTLICRGLIGTEYAAQTSYF